MPRPLDFPSRDPMTVLFALCLTLPAMAFEDPPAPTAATSSGSPSTLQVTEQRRELSDADLDLFELSGILERLGNPTRGTELGPGSMDLAPAGDLLLQIGSEGRAWVWDVRTGEVVTRGAFVNQADTEGSVAARYMSDGRILALWSDGIARVHDGRTLEILSELGECPAAVSLEASPGGDAFLGLPFLFDQDVPATPLTVGPLKVQPGVGIDGGILTHGCISDGAGVVALLGGTAEGARVVRVVDGEGQTHPGEKMLSQFLRDREAEGTAFFGSMAVSAKGDLLAIGTHGEAHLFDLVKLRPIASADTGFELVTRLVFGPKGKALYCGDASGQVATVRVKDGKTLRTAQVIGGSVSGLDLDGKGKLLAVGGQAGDFVFWDLKRKREAFGSPGLPGPIGALAFSPDGSTLEVAGRAGEIAEVRLPLEVELEGAVGPLGKVAGLHLDNDHRLSAWDGDGEVAQRVRDGEFTAGPLAPGPGFPLPEAVALRADGNALIADQTGAFGFLPSGKQGRLDSGITGVTVSPDGRHFALMDAASNVHVGEWKSSQPITLPPGPIDEDGDLVWPVGVSFAGPSQLVVFRRDETLDLHALDGTRILRRSLFREDELTLSTLMPVVDPRGDWVALQTKSEGLRFVSLGPEATMSRLEFEGPVVTSSAVSPDGLRLALGCSNGEVWVWNLEPLGALLGGTLDPYGAMAPEGTAREMAQSYDWLASRRGGALADYFWEKACAMAWQLERSDSGKHGLEEAILRLSARSKEDRGRAAVRKKVASAWGRVAAIYDEAGMAQLAAQSRRRGFAWSPTYTAPPRTGGATQDTKWSFGLAPGVDLGEWRVEPRGAVTARTLKGSNLATIEGADSTDVKVEARVTIGVNQRRGAGLVAGVTANEQPRIVGSLTLDSRKSTVNLALHDHGVRRRLGKRTFTVDPKVLQGEFTLRLMVEGEELRFEVEGIGVLRGRAESPVVGRTGLWIVPTTESAHPVRFEQIRVTPEPGPAPPRRAENAASGSPRGALLPRLESIAASGQGEDSLLELYGLMADAERVLDRRFRRALQDRIIEVAAALDPHWEARERALKGAGVALRKYLRRELEGERPLQALAILEELEGLAPTESDQLRNDVPELIAELEARIGRTGPSLDRPTPPPAEVQAPFARGTYVWGLPWVFSDRGVTVQLDPENPGSQLFAEYPVGDPSSASGDIEVWTRFQMTEGVAVGMTFGASSDAKGEKGWQVGVRKLPGMYELWIRRYEYGKGYNLTRRLVPRGPRTTDAALDLIAGYDAKKKTLHVRLNDGPVLRKRLKQPMPGGKLGPYAARSEGTGEVTLRAFRVKGAAAGEQAK